MEDHYLWARSSDSWYDLRAKAHHLLRDPAYLTFRKLSLSNEVYFEKADMEVYLFYIKLLGSFGDAIEDADDNEEPMNAEIHQLDDDLEAITNARVAALDRARDKADLLGVGRLLQSISDYVRFPPHWRTLHDPVSASPDDIQRMTEAIQDFQRRLNDPSIMYPARLAESVQAARNALEQHLDTLAIPARRKDAVILLKNAGLYAVPTDVNTPYTVGQIFLAWFALSQPLRVAVQSTFSRGSKTLSPTSDTTFWSVSRKTLYQLSVFLFARTIGLSPKIDETFRKIILFIFQNVWTKQKKIKLRSMVQLIFDAAADRLWDAFCQGLLPPVPDTLDDFLPYYARAVTDLWNPVTNLVDHLEWKTLADARSVQQIFGMFRSVA